jgi:hypothetical protein
MRANKVYTGGAAMKLLKIRWLLLITIVASGVAGVVGSNAGCGSSDNKNDGGGGTGGGGGGGGSDGGVALRFSNTFDTDKQGWTLSDYVDANYFNWGATTNPDTGVGLDGGVAPTLEWSSADGDPNPGSLKVTVTFTGFKQYVDPQVNISTPIDLTNRTVKARIRLVSGTFPAGGIQFHISSGLTGANAYVYVAAPFINSTSLTTGNWITISLDTSTVTPFDGRTFDPSQIVQVGVQFTTGDPYEGGVPTFGQAVFEIDTVQG